jgi:diacylglycerol O-acyltransferase / wax synthase
VTRLSASDASFYQLENSATPLYVGSLSILRAPRAGLSYETLLATVERQLPLVPRYRQKVRQVTMRLARPVWVDDHDFDITYHVRRSALPSPGSDEQLHELIGRLAARPLDRSRPLWEMYLVEGLAKNRLALYTKSHQALINGMSAMALGHVIADRNRRPPPFVENIWVPDREPGNAQLLFGAVGDWATRPQQQMKAVHRGLIDLATNSGQLVDAGRRMFDVARTLARGNAPRSPLNTTVSRNRRYTVAIGRLDDYRTIRTRYNCDVHDVVLAVVTGALRNWLLSRGDVPSPTATVRAMAPLPIYEAFDSSNRGQAISQVAPFLVDLPIGEGNTVVRLSQIAHATESNPTAASLVDARTIATLSGFAPPTLHAMGTRVATSLSPRLFNLLITNAPGTQSQMYVAGAKLLETYFVPPLLTNQVLAIGVTSYNGMLCFGINADREAMSDVDVLPSLLAESLDELLEAAQ